MGKGWATESQLRTNRRDGLWGQRKACEVCCGHQMHMAEVKGQIYGKKKLKGTFRIFISVTLPYFSQCQLFSLFNFLQLVFCCNNTNPQAHVRSTHRLGGRNVLSLQRVINLLSLPLQFHYPIPVHFSSSSDPWDWHREGKRGKKRRRKKSSYDLMGLEQGEKGSESAKGEGFARCSALSASRCSNRMESRCQNDKQMDCHNLIKMQGIQSHSHCCIVCGTSHWANPELWNHPYILMRSY